jgi:hypothetical protein
MENEALVDMIKIQGDSIEKASTQLLEHDKLIQVLSVKIEELQKKMKEKDEEISFIHRIFESS